MKSYARVIREFHAHPWAMLEAKYEAMMAFFEAKAAGLVFSAEEIAARIGESGAKRPPSQTGAVALVPVYGVLAKRMDVPTAISGGTSTDVLGATLRQLADDPNVGTIVLDIDSPGGNVAGMTELAAEIRAARDKKPIIAVSNTTMASAAYWLGSQASQVVVTPSGMVGSIGVLIAHTDESKANEKDGKNVTIIRSSPAKAAATAAEPLSDEAKAEIQGHVDYYAGLFRDDVAKGRGVSVKTVMESFGEGRMFNARDAVALGLADRIATLESVVDDAVSGRTMFQARSVGEQIAAEVAESTAIAAEIDGHAAGDQAEQVAPAAIAAELSALDKRRLTLRLLELG